MANEKAIEKIEKLTPEQEAKIPEYVKKYQEIGMSTRPTDRAKAEAAVAESYRLLNFSPPAFVWEEDPFAGARRAAMIAKGSEDVTTGDIQKQAQMASFGSFEAQWVSFYAFISEQLPIPKHPLVEVAKNIVEECGVYWTFDGMVVMTPKPTQIHMKDGKLHNTEGPALMYPSGRQVFAVEGQRKASLMEVSLEGLYETEKSSSKEEA